MSFAPITRWALRCDGDTTRGQCPELLVYNAHPDADDEYLPPDTDTDTDTDSAAGEDEVAVEWREVLFDAPVLDRDARTMTRAAGWHAARDGRLLCRAHVAALEYLARAELDGLPFPTALPEAWDVTMPADQPPLPNLTTRAAPDTSEVSMPDPMREQARATEAAITAGTYQPGPPDDLARIAARLEEIRAQITARDTEPAGRTGPDLDDRADDDRTDDDGRTDDADGAGWAT